MESILSVSLGIFQIMSYSHPFTQKMGKLDGDILYAYGHFSRYQLEFIGLFGLAIYQYLFNNPATYSVIWWLIGLFGWYLRMYSYMSLGNFFTYTLGIRHNHQLITSGPYAYLSHPSYTGLFLVLLSSLLYYNQYIIGPPVIVWFIYRLIGRINDEEKMLTNHFGIEYTTFINSRFKLIPYIY